MEDGISLSCCPVLTALGKAKQQELRYQALPEKHYLFSGVKTVETVL